MIFRVRHLRASPLSWSTFILNLQGLSLKSSNMSHYVVPLAHQFGHVDRLVDILSSSFIAFDLSMMGSGKTFTTCLVATRYLRNNRHGKIVVVCPASVKGKWNKMRTMFGVKNIIDVMSYDTLRGTYNNKSRTSGVAHPYLKREDEITGPDIDTFFTATKRWKKLVSDGVVLVFDECQNLKNRSVKSEAARSLVKTIRSTFPYSSSRVLMLSGTPLDKQRQTVEYFRTMTVISDNSVPAQDVVRYCRDLSVSDTSSALRRALDLAPLHPSTDVVDRSTKRQIKDIRDIMASGVVETSHNRTRICFEMFQDVIIPRLAHRMPLWTSTPEQDEENLYVSNHFYDVRDESANKELRSIVSHLHRAVQEDEDETETAIHITTLLRRLEVAKVPFLVKMARKKLRESETSKVVLALNYKASVERAVSAMQDDYAVLRLEGDYPNTLSKRDRVVRMFQRRNDHNRVLIGNLHVMHAGIDLDDTDGGYPRTAFVSPNFSPITLFQFTKRFDRAKTKSKAHVFCVFCGSGEEDDRVEKRVLDILSEKGGVMKRVHDRSIRFDECPSDSIDDMDTSESSSSDDDSSSTLPESILRLFPGSYDRTNDVESDGESEDDAS